MCPRQQRNYTTTVPATFMRRTCACISGPRESQTDTGTGPGSCTTHVQGTSAGTGHPWPPRSRLFESHLKSAWQQLQQDSGTSFPLPFEQLTDWISAQGKFSTSADGLAIVLHPNLPEIGLDPNAPAKVSSVDPNGDFPGEATTAVSPRLDSGVSNGGLHANAAHLLLEQRLQPDTPSPASDAAGPVVRSLGGADTDESSGGGITTASRQEGALPRQESVTEAVERSVSRSESAASGGGGDVSDGGATAAVAAAASERTDADDHGTALLADAEVHTDVIAAAGDRTDIAEADPWVHPVAGGGGDDEHVPGESASGGSQEPADISSASAFASASSAAGAGTTVAAASRPTAAPSVALYVPPRQRSGGGAAAPAASSSGGGGAPAASSPAAAAAGAAATPAAVAAAEAAAGGGAGAGDDLELCLAVVLPGEDLVSGLRRALVGGLRARPNRMMTFAEAGLRLAKHRELGAAWRDPASQLPKLKEFAEATVALVPEALKLSYNENWCQWVLHLDTPALRKAALRRAVAAAYPGEDDVSVVRRAAAAALIEAEGPGGVRHSMNMPALGSVVVQTANGPRSRLAAARGTTFSLAAVLTERLTKSPSPSPDDQPNNINNLQQQQQQPPYGRQRSGSNGTGSSGGGGGYISLSPLISGSARFARLDADRLLQDAAAGRLGDLTRVQPVPPRGGAIAGPALMPAAPSPSPAPSPAAAAAASAPAPAPAASGSGAGIPPRVKEALRSAIPEGRPEALAKRALALVAAASLGATHGSGDPPLTLRSSPCGILLAELGLKPPKGAMRALFEEEPEVFQAERPSPNYRITLVHPGLVQLAREHPEQVAAGAALLLKGKSYAGLRLRSVGVLRKRKLAAC
ncbi:hypothetical protein Agub_g14437 [Astrephomene gubernaculifera]|uniref:Uncharacterized protein n=1 Tax=Astrephomene gubernaculifera TaxID=47775 RepID=A0AAD3E3N1_9CHLO|nr:hypothetical protein Agub_g14437 [Astrephomene gubernaculifera]